MKIYEFPSIFHWSLFLRVQLRIFELWFRKWFGTDQATSHYLNQWWLVYRRITRTRRVKTVFEEGRDVDKLISLLFAASSSHNNYTPYYKYIYHINPFKQTCYTVVLCMNAGYKLKYTNNNSNIAEIKTSQQRWQNQFHEKHYWPSI